MVIFLRSYVDSSCVLSTENASYRRSNAASIFRASHPPSGKVTNNVNHTFPPPNKSPRNTDSKNPAHAPITQTTNLTTLLMKLVLVFVATSTNFLAAGLAGAIGATGTEGNLI